MTEKALETSLEGARRLAVTKQGLAGKPPDRASKEDLVAFARDLALVQWDPVSVVAPSHVLAFWSRVGEFRTSDLDRLLWDEKRLFLTWTPIASIVPMDDYPLHHSLMRRYPGSLSDSWGAQRERARRFLATHKRLRESILKELEGGPRLLADLRGHVPSGKSADGWTPASPVSVMLSHLLMTGDVMVVGHRGNQNVWGLSEPFLPRGADRTVLPEPEVERLAAQRAIRALGTASPREIHYYFVRGRYLDLKGTLRRLEEESLIHRIRVPELGGRDERYVHDEDVPMLDAVTTDAWRPRISLLAPFDNLTCGRDRTKRLFGFSYIHEQFLPKEKRTFGTCLLPILYGDRFIGRIDARMEREEGVLRILSVHAEPRAPKGREVASEIGETIARLAGFLGAQEVAYSARVPASWRSSLR